MVQVRALFSATLPEGVEEMAASVLQAPLRLTVGPRNAPTSTVAQRLMFVGREGGKLLGLRQLIAQGLTPPVLLFVSSKERAEAVHRSPFGTMHSIIISQQSKTVAATGSPLAANSHHLQGGTVSVKALLSELRS